VIDDSSKWMSFHDAVAYVEATQQCYEELAIELLRQATHSLKIRSQTVQSSPRWVKSGDKYYVDDGKDLEFCRKDVLEFWSTSQKVATRSTPPQSRAARWNGILSAIHEIWPDGINVRAKDRNREINEWLRFRGIIGKHDDVTRTIQRVLRTERDAHK
jgi:hypothetical protein